jgi:hypothetical protein
MGFFQPHGGYRGGDGEIALTISVAAKPENEMILQWIALVLLIGMMGGLLYLFLRSGMNIKPDTNRKNDDWPNITQGGS